MGMFDNIVPECDLPGGADRTCEYQTKDTPAQGLEIYYITTDGRLEIARYKRSFDPSWDPDDPIIQTEPFILSEPDGREPVEFTGSIHFYGSGGYFVSLWARGRMLWLLPLDEVVSSAEELA